MKEQNLNTLKKYVKKHNLHLNTSLSEAFDDNKMLTVVLKHHFLVENLINRILETKLYKPGYFLKKSFSEKVKLFEALGLDNEDEELKTLIWGINDIRNEFAHNPKFDLFDSKVGRELLKKMSTQTHGGRNNTERFSNSLLYLCGYLTTMLNMHVSFPVMWHLEDLDKDLWLKKNPIHKKLVAERNKWLEDQEIQHIVTDTGLAE